MTDPKPNPLDIFCQQIAAVLGNDTAQAFRAVAQNPVLGGHVHLDTEGLDGDTAQALQQIAALFAKKAEAEVAPPALRTVHQGVGESLGYRNVTDSELRKGTKREGLVEALSCLAEAKDKAPGAMHNAQVDVPRYRYLERTLPVYRDMSTVALRLTRQCVRNQLALESEAAQRVTTDYGVVREAAQRDDNLMELVEPAEQYAYGSAQKGVANRGKNQHFRKTAEAEAQKSGMARARREARTDIATELQSFMDELSGHLPAPGSAGAGQPAPVPSTDTPTPTTGKGRKHHR